MKIGDPGKIAYRTNNPILIVSNLCHIVISMFGITSLGAISM